MLELKKITKTYQTGEFKQTALRDVSLSFRKNEFVAILGPSGSGKTTLLNIIGGLDRYDGGDLIINNKSTKKFNDTDWDAYRNNCIGFIFQNYNLISHISILENVEMGMTLSGVSPSKKRKKAMDVLKRVGLLDHKDKKPNQLSGGQMQRVAIARALANDPDIILADEPTGALDTKTSVQIMDLIKTIAKDKLVIMVTHNPDLAKDYASRVVEMQDGVVLHDSNPVKEDEKAKEDMHIRKTSMGFLTALKLSFNNIRTKKGRTALTAFAASIGIIGIALILSLSNGFKIQIDKFEKNTLSQAPIIISQQAVEMSKETMDKFYGETTRIKYPTGNKIYVQEDVQKSMMHVNHLTNDYLDFIKKLDPNMLSGVSYQTATNFTILNHGQNGYHLIDTTNMGTSSWTVLPTKPNGTDNTGIIENTYDVLAGQINENEPGLILQVDSKNQIYRSTLEQLGFTDEEEVSFEDILNKELKVVLNDDYYKQIGDNFIPSTDYESLYNNKNSISIKVQAIIRGQEGKEMITSGSGFAYTNALTELVISKNKESNIVKAQEKVNYNILTKTPFDAKEGSNNTKDIFLSYLGADTMPIAIYLYPKDFETKDAITTYLDSYNDNKQEADTILYTDMAAMISTLSGNIMDAITIVLVAFSAISLVVSSIMIGIITYISVLERTKEIGILRSLGARKKDIRRVFNAETFIIGVVSGLLGILIAYLLTVPVNMIIESLSGLAGVAKLNPLHAFLLVLISSILTIISGTIPSHMASKKDPVIALRTE